MSVYYALDLRGIPDQGSAWRTLRRATSDDPQFSPGRPGGGFATPTGFWFIAAEHPDATHGNLTIDFIPGPGDAAPSADANRGLTTAADDRRLPTVCVPLGRNGLAPPEDGCLQIEVGWTKARVHGLDGSTSEARDAVLLALSQCWRFLEIDFELDELTAWARGELNRRPYRRPGEPPSLRVKERALRTLVLDLPAFEAPLGDPRGYFASRDGARLYSAIAKQLGLNRWREVIDERVEILEEVYARIIDARRHAHLFMIEILILLVLTADLVAILAAGLGAW